MHLIPGRKTILRFTPRHGFSPEEIGKHLIIHSLNPAPCRIEGKKIRERT
jgi:hypothetical protein